MESELQPETIEVLPHDTGDAPGHLWSPEPGPELEHVLKEIPESSRETVRQEALDVLAKSLPPDEQHGRRTGLVIGYIQSGKTLSFTAVSALARDNGYRMVIIIAGMSKNLLEQTTSRLQEDLSAAGPGRRWKLLPSSNRKNIDAQDLRDELLSWRDEELEDEDRRALLIPVMKERHHLDWLIETLRQLNLDDVPTLIIDDEADQASLNTQVDDGEQSATYRRINGLRDLLSHHTFLQYTATPQAPLLINIIDRLSPEFGAVLTPGEDYTGGRTFFGEGYQDLVQSIPGRDLPDPDDLPLGPPESLQHAMRLFFIGAAAAIITRTPPQNRSMIIHPHYKTDVHHVFKQFANRVRLQWEDILGRNEGDRDRTELIEQFRQAHAEIDQTVEDLPPFDDVRRRLPLALRRTTVLEMNTRGGRKTPDPDWNLHDFFILVGGQALDRGFTVEGLITSYMPRGVGVGNADTVQQRARWFGYKANYLGYCRVFLSGPSRDVYRQYVKHEEDMRKQLRTFAQEGRRLQDWRRVFLLDPGLRPTRESVIDENILRGTFSNSWFYPRMPHYTERAVKENRECVREFCTSLEFSPEEGDERRRPNHRHQVARGVPLQRTYEELLVRFKYPYPNDTMRHLGLLRQIEHYLTDHPDAVCTLYLMRPDVEEPTRRGTHPETEEIRQLFGGAYPVQTKDIYPGDRNLYDDVLTVQLHHLDIYHGAAQDGELLMDDVPAMAARVPRVMSADWIAQDQQPTADE